MAIKNFNERRLSTRELPGTVLRCVFGIFE